MATTIFSNALTLTSNIWQGAHVRVVIGTANLSAAPNTNAVQVSFKFAATTSAGAIDSAYIGEQGSGNAYNDDGNQQRLTFNGSGSKSGITGAVTVLSDRILYPWYTASTPLVVAMHLSGTEVDFAKANLTGVDTWWITEADTQTGASAPTGTFTQYAGILIGVGLITMDMLAVDVDTPIFRVRQGWRAI